MENLSIDSRIKREKTRLKKIFKDLREDQAETVQGLIDSAAFLRITLQRLESDINGSAPTEKYQHGENQSGMKTSAALQSYVQTGKLYAGVIRQLVNMLPKAERATAADEFDDFLSMRDHL